MLLSINAILSHLRNATAVILHQSESTCRLSLRVFDHTITSESASASAGNPDNYKWGFFIFWIWARLRHVGL